MQNVEQSFVTYSCAVHWQSASTNREARSWAVLFSMWSCPVQPILPLGDMTMLHCHMLHAVPENILVYYDLVPLQFWSRNVALSFVNMVSGCSHYPHESQHSIHCSRLTVLLPLTAVTYLRVLLVHVLKAGDSWTHHHHVTAVLP